MFAPCLALVILLTATPAHAAPALSQKRARAVEVQAQVAALDDKVEMASEDYNESRARYLTVSADVNKAKARIGRIDSRVGILRTRLGTRAVRMYRSGPYSFLEVLFGASTFEQFSSTWDLLKDLNRSDAKVVSELRQARSETAAEKRKLEASKAEAKAAYRTMTARKRTIDSQLAQRKSMLTGLESQIDALEAERRAAAKAGKTSFWQRVVGWAAPPPTRRPRSEVVDVAKRYIGAPYRWGAAGPGAFDCSGFTMYVFGQVGVSLPHSSRAQFDAGERVGRADLEPGDLVFFGRGRIHHVGIYVGGGAYIHSPNTGSRVRIDALDRGDYAGACRP